MFFNCTSRARRLESFFRSTRATKLCLLAIAWAGLDIYFYLSNHEDSQDAFAIPHDSKIHNEVVNVDPDDCNRKNVVWDSFGIRELIDALPNAEKTTLFSTIAGSVLLLARYSPATKVEKTKPLSCKIAKSTLSNARRC